MLPASLLAILACPRCKGPLRVEDAGAGPPGADAGGGPPGADGALVCGPCRLRYRVEGGVPVLLIDEAEALPA